YYLCLTLCLIFSLAQPAYAQTTSTGLTITPPLQQIELQSDQPSHQSTLIITNHQDQPVNLTMSVVDFGDLEQGGGLAFLGNTPDSIWDKYRLAPWLTVTPQATSIPAHGQQTFEITITNDQELSPGGHYAAVIAN